MVSKVIFKCDDLEELSDNVLRFDSVVRDMGIKVSWGIIGRFCKKASPEYINWVRDKNASGVYEFWNHGYYHGSNYGHGYKPDNDYQYEFIHPSVFRQYRFIKKTQKIVQEKFGIKLQCFGAPANHISWKTAVALFFHPEIRAWFYGIKFNKYIFNRYIEIEFPFGHVVFDKFKDAYEKYAANHDLLCYQLHPNMWKEQDFNEFVQVVKFLKQNNVEFVLPHEIYKNKKLK